MRPKVLPIRVAVEASARWGAQMSKPSVIANSKSLSIFEHFIAGASAGSKARASIAVLENSKYELSVVEWWLPAVSAKDLCKRTRLSVEMVRNGIGARNGLRKWTRRSGGFSAT